MDEIHKLVNAFFEEFSESLAAINGVMKRDGVAKFVVTLERGEVPIGAFVFLSGEDTPNYLAALENVENRKWSENHDQGQE